MILIGRKYRMPDGQVVLALGRADFMIGGEQAFVTTNISSSYATSGNWVPSISLQLIDESFGGVPADFAFAPAARPSVSISGFADELREAAAGVMRDIREQWTRDAQRKPVDIPAPPRAKPAPRRRKPPKRAK